MHYEVTRSLVAGIAAMAGAVPNEEDIDNDGIPNNDDNCPYTTNPNQVDIYPPDGNGIGDTPYQILTLHLTGENYDYDNYPLMNPSFLTPNPEPEFPTILVVASVIILVIVAVGILAYYKKYRRRT